MIQEQYIHQIVGNLINFIEFVGKNRLKHNNVLIKNNDNSLRLDATTQYPLFNGIFDFQHNESNFRAQLEDAVTYFNAKQQPFSWWWLQNSPIPKYMEKILHEMGFVSAGEYSGIMLDLLNFNDSQMLPNNITIKQIKLNDDYETYCHILFETFQIQEPIKTEMYEMLQPSSVDFPFIHYLGFYDQKPVGIVTAFIEDDVVGLYCGATLPQARKRGICTALIAQALQDAKLQGCKIALAQLMAKNMAARIITSLGFKTMCNFTPYVYGMSPEHLEP